MSCSPDELKKRSDALGAKWQAFLGSHATDLLLEFAVSVSSFTEFLHGKGLSGLHQISRSLEQQALALIDADNSAPLPQTTLDELTQRVQELGARVADFIDSNSRPVVERRANPGTTVAFDIPSRHRIWLLGSHAAPWQELILQLG